MLGLRSETWITCASLKNMTNKRNFMNVLWIFQKKVAPQKYSSFSLHHGPSEPLPEGVCLWVSCKAVSCSGTELLSRPCIENHIVGVGMMIVMKSLETILKSLETIGSPDDTTLRTLSQTLFPIQVTREDKELHRKIHRIIQEDCQKPNRKWYNARVLMHWKGRFPPREHWVESQETGDFPRSDLEVWLTNTSAISQPQVPPF